MDWQFPRSMPPTKSQRAIFNFILLKSFIYLDFHLISSFNQLIQLSLVGL